MEARVLKNKANRVTMRQFMKPKQTVNISNSKVKNWYGPSLSRGNSIAYSLLQSLSFVANAGVLWHEEIIFRRTNVKEKCASRGFLIIRETRNQSDAAVYAIFAKYTVIKKTVLRFIV